MGTLGIENSHAKRFGFPSVNTMSKEMKIENPNLMMGLMEVNSKKYDWSKFDPNKTTKENADLIGCDYRLVAEKAYIYRFELPTTRSRIKALLDSVTDWDVRPTSVIADELGINIKTVKKYLKERNIPFLRLYTVEGAPEKLKWSIVDWSKSKKEIAELLGTSTTTVSRYARKHNIKFPDERNWVDYTDVDWEHESVIDIAKRKNVDKRVIWNYAKKHNIKCIVDTKNKPVDLSGADFEHCTKQEIAKQFNVDISTIFRYIKRNGIKSIDGRSVK